MCGVAKSTEATKLKLLIDGKLRSIIIKIINSSSIFHVGAIEYHWF